MRDDPDDKVVDHPSIAGQPRQRLRIVSANRFLEAPPARRWFVRDMVPAQAVTLLTGDGATGKSLLALQLAVASALRHRWLGMDVHGGRALYISCEDDIDEMHRRVSSIVRADGTGAQDRLDDLDVVSLAGEEAVFAYPERIGANLTVTPLFRETESLIAETTPSLVILDTLADVFGGDENHRAQARQFIALLRGWCAKHGTTILVLAHPSLTGLSSGAGTSGSTGWSNSVRSRIYLERPNKGAEDARILTTKKANYARAGRDVRIEWHKGAFRPLAKAEAAPSAVATIEATKALFLDLLADFNQSGRRVSSAPSANYAPAVFAKDPRAAGTPKAAFLEAMQALFAERRLRIEEKGPKSRPERRLVEVGKEQK